VREILLHTPGSNLVRNKPANRDITERNPLGEAVKKLPDYQKIRTTFVYPEPYEAVPEFNSFILCGIGRKNCNIIKTVKFLLF
jgi:hypothetical protein